MSARKAGFAVLSALLLVVAPAPAQTRHHSVFLSVDRGRTWVQSNSGLSENIRTNAFAAFDRVVFAGTDAGIYRSEDQGRSWKLVPGAGATSGRILCFASLGTSIFAGTDRSGILVSPDRGLTWSRVPNVRSAWVRSLVNHAGGIYAGTNADGVLVSLDGGLSWGTSSEGLPGTGQVFSLMSAQGRIFAALYARGLFTRNERERRWKRVGEVTPLVVAGTGTTLIVGHNPGGIFRSDDLGASWTRGTDAQGLTGELAGRAPVWEMGSTGNLVFAGVASGIYFSEDQGRTWARSRTGLPPESSGVAFLVTDHLVLASTITADKS